MSTMAMQVAEVHHAVESHRYSHAAPADNLDVERVKRTRVRTADTRG